MNAILAAATVLAAIVGTALYLGIRNQRRAASAVQAALKERNELFLELQHRVKNSFTTIASLINIELSRTPDETVRSTLETLGGRVETLAALYRLMHEGQRDGQVDLPYYLREIIDGLSAAVGISGLRIELDCGIQELAWDAKRASSLGLILNELVTNAYKHASPGNAGAVRVRLERTGPDIVLTVSNPADPLPEGFIPGKGAGFGLRLISELVRQFQGSMEVGSSGGRVDFSVRVPA